jgi:hypothetical protein
MAAPVDVDTMGQPIDSLSREERVRRRAQEIYRLRGNRPGSAVGDWLRAEEEIREAEEQAIDEASGERGRIRKGCPDLPLLRGRADYPSVAVQLDRLRWRT